MRIPVPLFVVKNLIRNFRNRAQWKDIPRARAGFEKLTKSNEFISSKCQYSPEKIEYCQAEWIKKVDNNTNKVLLYFHGGGYAVGSINTHRSMLTKITLAGNFHTLSFEYRLAPENPYPAALQDAVMAYKWLLQNGYSNDDIALGGDSAGGGLTLATLLYLRDHDIPLPKSAILLSPWTDLTFSGNSYHNPEIEEPMLVKEAFPYWGKNYYGNHDPANPYISPVFGKYSGLPPIYIQVGSAEILLDDSIRVYEKALMYGVKIDLDIYEDYFHVFQSFWRVLPKANTAIKKLSEFIDAQFARVEAKAA